QYNRWGDMIGTHGFVNLSNLGCGVCGMSGCTADHFSGHGDWFDDDWGDYDDDFYYYREKGKKKKRKKFKNRKRFKYDD
ncbi:MAG: hypothetical protein KJO77_08530, partial [Bacteroidia bacterium]|nr:hypothetical protein [Bacteroidia bacterium]